MSLTRVTGARVAPPMAVDHGFDPTYGCTLDDLLTGEHELVEPDDLDRFWRDIAAEAELIDPAAEIGAWRRAPGDRAVEAAVIHYRSLDGRRIGGWVVRPVGPVRRAVVVGHGYGGRAFPEPADVPDDAIAIFPVARGLPTMSTVPGVGDGGVHHVLWGIDSPRTYSHVGSVVDTWMAARIVRNLAPHAESVTYMGSSFGGGIGALALGFGGAGFDAGILGVPSFGDRVWRSGVPSIGSAHMVRAYRAEHTEVVETLRYADAAMAARRIHVPMLVLPALADPSVPPPGQFAVVSSLPGPTWVHVLAHGHCQGGDGCETDATPQAEAIAEFFAHGIGTAHDDEEDDAISEARA